MTLERYRELLKAGPDCTSEQLAALKTFQPKLKPLAVAVNVALHYWGWNSKLEMAGNASA